MGKIVQKLKMLGFSKTEAKVYITLLKHSKLNGYQISKILNLSRSSIYLALENLCRKNFIYLISGELNEYYAEKPEIIIERVRNHFIENADFLKQELNEFSSDEPEENFFNIKGVENLIEKVREILQRAETEILLNTTLDPFVFEKELRAAAKRGVRCILFSMSYKDIKDLPVEFYYYTMEDWPDEPRIMAVADCHKVIIGGNLAGRELIGTFTENPVLVKIVAEHITHDIYLSKLHHKRDNDKVIDTPERINTISEIAFYKMLESIHNKTDF